MKQVAHLTADELGLTEQDLQDIISNMTVVDLEIEKMQGVYYAWDRDTGKFLGQGEDRDSLIVRISEQSKGNCAFRFPENHAEIFGDPETP